MLSSVHDLKYLVHARSRAFHQDIRAIFAEETPPAPTKGYLVCGDFAVCPAPDQLIAAKKSGLFSIEGKVKLSQNR
jgi:hypothetical protein